MGPRLKLPRFVHGFIDRHGKPRFYFRRRGFKQVALPGLPHSTEFMDAYRAALEARQRIEINASRTAPGTINSLVVSYYRSDAWHQLAEDTRKTRRRIIEKFRAEHGDKRAALLEQKHIIKMLGEIERPSAKRHWLKAIRGLMQAAVPTMRKNDPTAGVAGIKLPKSRGHHTWTDAEIEQYRAYWPLGTQQRLVFEFALETVSRRGEVVRLGPQHVKNGRIRIERTHGSADVDIPISAELQACVGSPNTATPRTSSWRSPVTAR
jgi:integrase